MFRQIFLLLVIAGAVITGCSKNDDDNDNAEITVFLKDSKGTALSEWVVYAYDEAVWRAGSTIAAKQSATDANGKAVFSLRPIDILDGQEVYRFVVYYTKNYTNILGNKKTSETLEKVVPVTIKRSQNQTVEINL